MRRIFLSCHILFALALLGPGCCLPLLVGDTPQVTLSKEGENYRLGYGFGDVSSILLVKVPDRDYWIGDAEVSFRQFEGFPTSGDFRSSHFLLKKQPGYSPDWPATMLLAEEMEKYCRTVMRKVSKDMPKGYVLRLPTTKEWAEAAACGDGRVYPWGNEWPPTKMANGRYPNIQGSDRYEMRHDSPYYIMDFFGYRSVLSDQAGKAGVVPRPPADADSLPDSYMKGVGLPDYFDGYPGPAPVMACGRNEWGLFGFGGNAAEVCYDVDSKEYVSKGINWGGEVPLAINHNRPITKGIRWYSKPMSRVRGFRIAMGAPYDQLEE